MNDLVKRLRHAGNDSMNHDCIYTPELIEAADALERGYAENKLKDAVVEAARAIKPISAKYAKDDRTIYWQICSIQYKALKDTLKQLERVSTEQRRTQNGNTCPGCGGPADNGHDRSIPPNPYYCTKCFPVEKGLDREK